MPPTNETLARTTARRRALSWLAVGLMAALLAPPPLAAQPGKTPPILDQIRKQLGGGTTKQKRKKDKEKDKKDKKPTGDQRTEAERDTESLPQNYEVPPEPPASMTMTDEWVVDPWGGNRQKRNSALDVFRKVMDSGDPPTDEQKRTIDEVVEWWLSRMTLRKHRDRATVPLDENEHPSITRSIMGQDGKPLMEAGKYVKRYREPSEMRGDVFKRMVDSPVARGAKKDARIYMMEMVVKHAPRLFDYHFTARTNGAVLLADLAELNMEDGEGAKKPAIKFTKQTDALMQLVDDREQDLAVRTWGVIGLVRIAVLSEVKRNEKNRIIETLVRALQNGRDDFYWYPWRIVQGLGEIGLANTLDGRPTVAQALAEVLVNKQQHWMVRAEAAQSLGRLNYASEVDLGLIAHEIAELTRQMIDAYVQEPRRAGWKRDFFCIYGAFKPLNEDDAKRDKGLLRIVEKGTMTAYRKTVQEVYELVRPLVERVLKEAPDAGEELSRLKNWLNSNPPRSNKIAEGMPIILTAPALPRSEAPQTAGGKTG
ncbi:MAG: HEAT repeat domain-containing protein [Planctomycetaceae bacterium]